MKSKKRILVIGGDDRQKYLTSYLTEKNIKCDHICKSDDLELLDEAVLSADIIILPLPVSKNGVTVYSSDNSFKLKLYDICNMLKSNHVFIGGIISDSLKSELNDKNLEYRDYYDDESLIIHNAYLTALGTVRLILENTDEHLLNKKILITGFGNVAVAVSQYFKALGGEVCIAARNNAQRTKAHWIGYETIDISDMQSCINEFDYIINTVPSHIFTKSDIENIKDSGAYVELASKPFGAEKDWFSSLNKKYIPAPSLPGRMFPKASAQAILSAIIDLIEGNARTSKFVEGANVIFNGR